MNAFRIYLAAVLLGVCVYLLIHSFRSGGDVRKLLTGER